MTIHPGRYIAFTLSMALLVSCTSGTPGADRASKGPPSQDQSQPARTEVVAKELASGVAVSVSVAEGTPAPSVSVAASKGLVPPVATRLLGEPVAFEGDPGPSGSLIRFDYSRATLPPSADPELDVTIVRLDDESKQWIPMGGDIDATAKQISIVTPQYSTWGVAVTDPDALRREQAWSRHLNESLSGSVIQAMYGKNATLTCNPDLPLLTARISGDAGREVKACQNYRSQGVYRLDVVDEGWLPRLYRIPQGITVIRADSGLSEKLAETFRSKFDGGALVNPGGLLQLEFGDSALDSTPSPVIVGTTDYGAAAVGTMLQVAQLVAGSASNPYKDQARLVTDAQSAYECITDTLAPEDGRRPSPRQVADQARTCRGVTQLIAEQTLKKANPGYWERFTNLGFVKWVSRRLDIVDGVEAAMNIARTELAVLLKLATRQGNEIRVTPVPIDREQLIAADWRRKCQAQAGSPRPSPGIEIQTLDAKADYNGDETPDPVIVVRCAALTTGHSWKALAFDGKKPSTDVTPLAEIPPAGDDTDVLEIVSLRPTSPTVFTFIGRGRSKQAHGCCADQRVTYTLTWNGSSLAVSVPALQKELEPTYGSGRFSTPTGNIGCILGDLSVQCTVKQHTWKAPPRPPSDVCEWGHSVGIKNSVAQYMCSDTHFIGPTLEYGTTAVFGRYTCTVARTGVTCREEGRTASFFVSRDEVRLK